MDFIIGLLPFIVNGLSLGLLFALITLGFMLIIGVMELILRYIFVNKGGLEHHSDFESMLSDDQVRDYLGHLM